MELFITGATGLIGRRLVLDRLERGDRVVVLSRNAERASRLFAADANPNVRAVEGDATQPGEWQRWVEGCDAVINLAGAGIADRRWTESYKRELRDSRVESTRNIVAAIDAAVAGNRPKTLLNASAVGFYGRTGDVETDESASAPPRGSDFLADLCVDWEAEASRAWEHGVRVVLLRTSMVLDDRGGPLPQMMTPFRWFVGGKLGNGRQFMPWIHYRDEVGLIDFALSNPKIEGPLNLAAPNPVRNREFTRLLARAMGRPAIFRVPRLALRIALGEFAGFLLASQRVVPGKALAHGYQFVFPYLGEALESLIDAMDRRNGDGGDGEPPIKHDSEALATQEIRRTGHAADRTSGNPHAGADGAPATERPRREAPASRIRLCAIDVDGTLLRSDGRIAQSVIDACRAAARGGCVIVPATARPPRTMQSIIQSLGTTGPTINYNGALIWNPLDRVAQYHEAMDVDLVREIIDEARDLHPEVVVSVEILDRWFTDLEPDFVGSLDAFLTQPVTKLMLLARDEGLTKVREMVRDRYWASRRIGVFTTDPHVIQIVHPMVDKGIALQRIARRMGATRDEVMAIGDGPNDAGMVEWAGFSIAVDNACDTVRSLADAVVPSNDEFGVARALQRFVLNHG